MGTTFPSRSGQVTGPEHGPPLYDYACRALGSAETDIAPERLWAQIVAIGGGNGWYYLDGLWQLRGRMDGWVNGVGMRGARADGTPLAVGDTLDVWRVAGLDPYRRLTLVAEMRLPGAAGLELTLEPLAEGRTRVVTTAYFDPHGLLGHLYWQSLLPIHLVLFRGLSRAIVERARAVP